jgi:hypothetical protein
VKAPFRAEQFALKQAGAERCAVERKNFRLKTMGVDGLTAGLCCATLTSNSTWNVPERLPDLLQQALVRDLPMMAGASFSRHLPPEKAQLIAGLAFFKDLMNTVPQFEEI